MEISMSFQDYVTDSEEQANSIGPLVSGSIPIAVTTLLGEGKLNYSDIRVYLYLLHNEDVHRSRTHKVSPHRIADMMGMNLRSVYRSLNTLCELDVLFEGETPYVYVMPHSIDMRRELTTRKANSKERQAEANYQREVEQFEANGRKLSASAKSRIREKHYPLQPPKPSTNGTGTQSFKETLPF